MRKRGLEFDGWRRGRRGRWGDSGRVSGGRRRSRVCLVEESVEAFSGFQNSSSSSSSSTNSRVSGYMALAFHISVPWFSLVRVAMDSSMFVMSFLSFFVLFCPPNINLK